jgi:hypothetical protein
MKICSSLQPSAREEMGGEKREKGDLRGRREEISRIDDGGAEVVESVVVRTEDERAVVW